MESAAVIDALWRANWTSPEEEVFALLDAARDPNIYDLVRRSGLDYRCLFQGKLNPEFARASPYLVNLSRKARFTRTLIEQGWGQSWGVFLRSSALLQELQRHFREFLQVEDETGKLLFFRFYDPRVLRAYLPTCTPEELVTFFGPTTSFAMETADSFLKNFGLDDDSSLVQKVNHLMMVG